MKLFFRVYDDYSRINNKCLQMYLKDSNNQIYVIKSFAIERYEVGTQFAPINDLDNNIEINEIELKRMSKELYSELSDETAYLKGSLQATKNHLEDMRSLVFNNKQV